mmetsp:Transcript_8139/g.9481  ORF Transcript_8139/g.9481 Transcript_8139/m.9481 type:complete len:82 (-) Transcript_8139:249-494(-)
MDSIIDEAYTRPDTQVSYPIIISLCTHKAVTTDLIPSKSPFVSKQSNGLFFVPSFANMVNMLTRGSMTIFVRGMLTCAVWP